MLHSIYGYTHSEHNIEWFDDQYRYLYLWIHQCLDCYRIELQSITYPIFIHFIFELLSKHAFENAQNFYYKYNKEHQLLHSQDISQIYELIQTIDNKKRKETKENSDPIHSYPIYNRYRKYKYQISLSQISHNLLMSWLNSSKFKLLIRTINDHINFKIISHEPLKISENICKPPLGIDDKTLFEMNKNKISWGISRYIDQIETKSLRDRQSININNYNNNNKSKSYLIRTEFCDIHPSQPKYSKQDEKIIENEIKNRVYAGPDRLPSICSYKFINSNYNISCSNISTNGKWIVCGCNDSTIRLFNVSKITAQSANSFDDDNKKEEEEKEKEEEEEETYISSKEESIDEYKNNLHCNKLIGHKSSITSISFYPDREFFISSSCDNTVRLWSTELSGKCLSWYRGHCFPIWDCSFSPLGLYFATASHDRTARLWSTDKGTPLRIFAGHISDVECVKFHPNCNYIATGSSDKTIRLWDIQSGNCVRLMNGHFGPINDLQFTSDGRCIVSASKDNTIRIWDIATSECIAKLKGHNDNVTKIALAHSVNRNAVIIQQSDNNDNNHNKNKNNGQHNISSFPLIISSSMDNTIRFWDVNNPEKPLRKTIKTNISISHLEMTKSNLLMLSGTVS